ncbi:MAG TPA: leucyl aminopeptidase family protein [Pseudonocardiaceae bacterium]|nr:leucyl aminopeptidase family protein [Pseudonocardiaceae bacterium]
MSVELSDLRRRGTPLAVLVAPGAEDGDDLWFGPGEQWLPADQGLPVGVTGKAGEVWTVPEPPGGTSNAVRWLAGVGGRTPADWRSAGGALIRSIQDSSAGDDQVRSRPTVVDIALPTDVEPAELGAFAVGMQLGGYRFTVTNDRSGQPRLRTVRLWLDRIPDSDLDTALRAELTRAIVLSSAAALARDLSNMPSNVKDPAWLAGTAARVTADMPGLTVTVRDENWLAEQGFGGVLAVGGGSVRPPRFVELAWRPRAAAGLPHLVLIGKGVTFDTGGISLKQAAGMHLMRTDMSGAAAVIAAVRGIASLRLPIRVTGLAPTAENHVSGSAYRPGDIVRHYDGRTTEVTNTDAEGRMLLADALGYAVRRLRPDLLVDVATLTGAMKVSLGLRTAGLFATDDDLAQRIDAAGVEVGERWWRMPLLDAHAEDVISDIADVRQCPPGPGGIGAALFLREFTAGLPWAHLDVAGPARSDKTYDEVTVGGTGFATRTLIALAESLIDSPRG